MSKSVPVLAVILSLLVPAGSAHATAQEVKLRGTYLLVHAERRMDASTAHVLQVGKRFYRLHFGVRVALRPQAPVEVQGTRIGNTISVRHAEQLAAPAPLVASGVRKLLVINLAWGSQVLTTTPSTATGFVFGTSDPQRRSVRQYYQDVSYGQLDWVGDVTPVLRIGDPSGCSSPDDLYEIATAADQAAAAAGYDLSLYDNRMYNFPRQYCGSGAWGEVGGQRSWVADGLWNIDDGYARMAPDHELGHNLGEYHGHGLDCGSQVVTASCLASSSYLDEYGFSYDLMGNNWTSDGYDAVNWPALPHEINLGWFAGRFVELTPPPTLESQAYTIAPIEQLVASSTQGLVITTATRRYFIEFRQPAGQDAFLTHWPDATTGVLISMRNDMSGGDGGPVNLDTAPDSDLTCLYCDFHDASLNVGQSFTDVDRQFMLTVGSATPTGAVVTVRWDLSPPVLKSPSVSFVSTLNPSSVPVKVAWSATDASAICAYDLQESVNGAAFASVPLAAPTSTSAIRLQGSGVRYRYRVAGTDCAGNRSAYKYGTAYALAVDDDPSPSIGYSGAWGTVATASAYGLSLTSSTASGDAATYTVTGRRIAWVSAMGPGRGRADIYVDGVYIKTADLYSSTERPRSVLYQKSWSSVAAHTLRIVNLGTAGRPRLDVDAFMRMY